MPVYSFSGRLCPDSGGVLARGVDVTTARVGVGVVVVAAADVGFDVGFDVGLDVGVLALVKALTPDPARVAAQEVAISASVATAATSRWRGTVSGTRSGSHATPIRMRGCSDGASHFMIATRFADGTATQPAVGLPSVTCRKKALPAP